MEQLLYERGEAAKLLNVSVRLVDYYVATGELCARRFGRRVLISRTELEKFSRRDHGGRAVRPRKQRKPASSAVAQEATR